MKANKIKTSLKILKVCLLIVAIVMLITVCNNNVSSSIKDRDTNDMNNSCEFDNPLTDLPWLKEIVDGIEKDAEAGYKQHARIYQCTYTDGTGFLLELHIGYPDSGYWLKSCKGESLCIMWGHAGDPCTKYNVDFENKNLIWEINN